MPLPWSHPRWVGDKSSPGAVPSVLGLWGWQDLQDMGRGTALAPRSSRAALLRPPQPVSWEQGPGSSRAHSGACEAAWGSCLQGGTAASLTPRSCLEHATWAERLSRAAGRRDRRGPSCLRRAGGGPAAAGGAPGPGGTLSGTGFGPHGCASGASCLGCPHACAAGLAEEPHVPAWCCRPQAGNTCQARLCAAGGLGAAQPWVSARLPLSRGQKWNQDMCSLPGSGLGCLLIRVCVGACGPLGSQFVECDAVPS